jgi:hypothetical protein
VKEGYWLTCFCAPEGPNGTAAAHQRIFEHFDDCGNILTASWEAEATWARVEVMGHRSHVGTVRQLPHGWVEVIPMAPDGTVGLPIRYGAAAIFAIHDLAGEEETRKELSAVRPAPYLDGYEDEHEDGNEEEDPW